MTTSMPPSSCNHEHKAFVRILPFFAGEGAVYKCTACDKKIIEKTGENFLSEEFVEIGGRRYLKGDVARAIIEGSA